MLTHIPKTAKAAPDRESGLKKVLMVAFHYPPFGGGTGVHRTLKFSRYLSEYGWKPIILTADPSAYARRSEHAEIPSNIHVSRAFALDAARHLSIKGRYLEAMAAPDRWSTWWPAAVAVGLDLIRKHRPDAIWSTYPIATAHWIGLALQRWSGLPWIADFRDPMIGEDGGEESGLSPFIRKVRGSIERRTINRCTRAVFTTPGALALYASRFPETPESRWAMIANGYDEEDFHGLETHPEVPRPRRGPFVIVHSGDLYRDGRNPTTFFKALSNLRKSARIAPGAVKVVLRATWDDEYYRGIIRSLGLEDVVYIEPPVSHRSAILEMLDADGLLLFQGAKFNRQIPAKAYEYLRAGRPVFALTEPAGDTASLLRSEGVTSMARLESEGEISEEFLRFLGDLKAGRSPETTSVQRHSRQARSRELATLLNSACGLTHDILHSGVAACQGQQ